MSTLAYTSIEGTTVDINAAMPSCQDPVQVHFTHPEEVSMTYRRITWENRVTGRSGSDARRLSNA
jgi:type VI secretion system secreted protein Hcp